MNDPRYEKYDTYGELYEKDTNMPCVIFPNLIRTKVNPVSRANWHEDPEVQYIISGEGHVSIDGESYNVCKGDIIIANSNSVHYTGTNTEIMYTAMIINSQFLSFADIDIASMSFESVIKSQKLEALFLNLLSVFEEELTYKKARVQSALLDFLIELISHRNPDAIGINPTNPSFAQIKDTIIYIRQNFNKKLTLDMLAEKVFVNKFTLARNFKTITGQTIVEFVNNCRCERAKQLIKSGLPVNEAAIRCGFNNMSFFTKTFKAVTGKLPSAYKHK